MIDSLKCIIDSLKCIIFKLPIKHFQVWNFKLYDRQFEVYNRQFKEYYFKVWKIICDTNMLPLFITGLNINTILYSISVHPMYA